MAQVPTIKILNPKSARGFRIINLSDFDPAIHQEFGAQASAPAPEPDAEPIPAPVVSAPPPFKRGPGRPRKAS